jgi:hypothetical protein
MKVEVALAVGSIPTTLLVMSTVGGATAQITGAQPDAVKHALIVAGASLVVASAATGSVPTAVTTALAVVATMYAMRSAWKGAAPWAP